MKATAWAGCSWGTALPIGALFGTTPGGPLGLLAFLLIMFVPQFETMFAEFGASLPAPTVLVMDLSRNLRVFWYLWFPLLGLGLGANALVLLALAHLRTWVWSLVLGVIQAVPLVVLPVMMGASMYLPIFTMARAIQ